MYENKRWFRDIFCNPKSDTKFEVAICFNDKGKLDSDPSMDEHRQSFVTIFDQIEHAIFKNQFLSFFFHDQADIFFPEDGHGPLAAQLLKTAKPTSSIYIRTIIQKMQKMLTDDFYYHDYHNSIFS